MKRLLIFAGSNSSKSINKNLATYAGYQIKDVDPTVLDLNDFEMPIYSSDRENSDGIPELAKTFVDHIKTADGIIISFAEHNGVIVTPGIAFLSSRQHATSRSHLHFFTSSPCFPPTLSSFTITREPQDIWCRAGDASRRDVRTFAPRTDLAFRFRLSAIALAFRVDYGPLEKT